MNIGKVCLAYHVGVEAPFVLCMLLASSVYFSSNENGQFVSVPFVLEP